METKQRGVITTMMENNNTTTLEQQQQRSCLICTSTTTLMSNNGRKQSKKYPRWHKYEGGYICQTCKSRLRYLEIQERGNQQWWTKQTE